MAIGAVLYAWLFPGAHVRWFLLAAVTILTFGILVNANPHFWGRHSFWGLITVLCILHLSVYVRVLLRVERWPSLLFVAVFMAELVVFNSGIAFLIKPKEHRGLPRSASKVLGRNRRA